MRKGKQESLKALIGAMTEAESKRYYETDESETGGLNDLSMLLKAFLYKDESQKWCCIIILDTSASRIYKKISGMEVVKWHRKKFMTRNLKFRL